MLILNNAILSIRSGLEDLAIGTPARNLSAIRNLHAGVVLLLKSRLLELSPAGSDEVLLKQKIKPRLDTSGTVEFVGTGKKTADVEEIKQRLVSLGVEMDWKRIDRLTVERNNIEHCYPQVSDEALRAGVGGAVAEAIGQRLARASVGNQVLCITHLPQIAALADTHFQVEKHCPRVCAAAD